jgi:hypothetical protein
MSENEGGQTNADNTDAKRTNQYKATTLYESEDCNRKGQRTQVERLWEGNSKEQTNNDITPIQ